MTEFRLKFEDENGSPLPITYLGGDGICLEGETSAWPRNFALDLWPESTATKNKWKEVRDKMHWTEEELRLFPSVVGPGEVAFREAAPGMLPSGIYSIRLDVEDLKLSKAYRTLTIKEDDPQVLTIKAKEDDRKFTLDRQISQFDKDIKRILLNSETILDGEDVGSWFGNTSKRLKRKVCLINLLAKLRVLSTAEMPLINLVDHIIFADVDRIYAAIDPAFLTEVGKHFTPDFFIERGHYRVLSLLKSKFPFGDFEVQQSFREPSKPSMQAIVTFPKSGQDIPAFCELDIDLGSPTNDLWGLITHIGELIMPGKTDHVKLGKSFKGDIRNFLYYTVQ